MPWNCLETTAIDNPEQVKNAGCENIHVINIKKKAWVNYFIKRCIEKNIFNYE